MIFVTGGSGFIGSNYIIRTLGNTNEKILNIDKLTYAGNPDNLISVVDNPHYQFAHADIGDIKLVTKLIKKYKPKKVINFAAESHVDRSILGPSEFIHTNILSTFNLLECMRSYFSEMNDKERVDFRFLHVSTDEVYGSLKENESPFDEHNQYKPNSPYSASKASSDHIVRSYNKTYGLPVITTNCSNNYGPFQFPEKLIPLVINNALSGKKIPIYGDGGQIRDWLYVDDHCDAINEVLNKGKVGETYNIGGKNEKTNLELVKFICSSLDRLKPKENGMQYEEQISFVEDRPGHDRRYAINSEKISKEIGWNPIESFESGIAKTIQWYLSNNEWIENVKSGAYLDWINKQYGNQE